MTRRAALTAILALTMACPALAGYRHRDEYTTTSTGLLRLELNPSDEVYGISFGGGRHLPRIPLAYDVFARVLENDVEDAGYVGGGGTLWLIQRKPVAPFLGAGGSYNYSLKSRTRDSGGLSSRGDSYWGTHVEAGLRLWPDRSIRVFEVLGRYTWSSEQGDRDYWLFGIGLGSEL